MGQLYVIYSRDRAFLADSDHTLALGVYGRLIDACEERRFGVILHLLLPASREDFILDNTCGVIYIPRSGFFFSSKLLIGCGDPDLA